MSATVAFAAAWRRSGRDAVVLMLLDLPGITLSLSSRAISTPEGTIWEEAIIDCSDIAAPGSVLESSWSPVTGGVTLGRVPLGQLGGATVFDALSTYKWVGAQVILMLWETSLTDGNDALVVLNKGIVQSYEVSERSVHITVSQRAMWNRLTRLTQVTPKLFPRAPESSHGMFIPKVRGSYRAIALRSRPWAPLEYSTAQNLWSLVTGGRLGFPGVLVDVGGGPTALPSKVAFASHACKVFNDAAKGCFAYIAAGGHLCEFDASVLTTFNNATDGTGFTLASVPSGGTDPYQTAFFPLRPVNSELAATNNAENLRAVLDVENDTSFAVLDYAGSKRDLIVRCPNDSGGGDIVSVTYIVGYLVYGGEGSHITLDANNGAGGIVTTTLPAGTGRGVHSVVDTVPLINTGWNFDKITLRVYFNGTADAADKARIYFVGAAVKFRPPVAIVGSRTITNVVEYIQARHDGAPGHRRPVWPNVHEVTTIEPIDSYAQQQWFCTLDGVPDSGGTYTGNGTDLIQRAPDIATHLLVDDAGLALSDIERGVGVFGSFVDARADLKTWVGTDMVHCLVCLRPERVGDVLGSLAEDSLCWFHVSEFDAKFKCVVWRTGKALDGPRIEVADVREIRIVPSSIAQRLTSLKLSYRHDWHTGRELHDTFVDASASSAGYRYRGYRDQLMRVYNSGADRNDRVEPFIGGLEYSATVPPAEYTPLGLATAVRAALVVVRNKLWVVACGPQVISGQSQKITFQEFEGAQNTFTATVAVGDYASFDALAVAIQTALNAVSSSWVVTCTRSAFDTTLQTYGTAITIARSAAKKFRIGWSGTVADASLSPVIGYTWLTGAAIGAYITTTTGRRVEEQLFVIGNMEESFSMRWATGTSGTNNTNQHAGSLLGFDPNEDSSSLDGVSLRAVNAWVPVGGRENLSAALGVDAESRTLRIKGETVIDDLTARELRNRAADLLCKERPLVRATLFNYPDIERGRVIEFSADLDALVPYSAYGAATWAGKRFMVIEKSQRMNGAFETEIVAMEVS